MVLFFVLSFSKNVSFAEELDDSVLEESNSIEFKETIDVNDPANKEVSEEEVILDYMEGQNVDRSTAKKELGIVSDEKISLAAASCKTSWLEIPTAKKTIDKLSGTTLQLYPYVQLKQCGSYGPAEVVSVSSNVGHNLTGMFKNGITFNVKDANKKSKYVVAARAKGSLKNSLGITLRNWSYSAEVKMVGGW